MARIIEVIGIAFALICFVVGITKIITSIIRGWKK